jgi:hypothetical protein
MAYIDNINPLRNLYENKNLHNSFDNDNAYLEQAFNDINQLWLENFAQIDEVNYLMIAEAPLWGQTGKYFYNPETKNSQFFYRSDLAETLGIKIADKQAFLNTCNNIGLLVLDISPFALNPTDTIINYRQLTPREYRQLISDTIPTYFAQKIEQIRIKKANDINVFFRYSRVRNRFEDLVRAVLINQQFIDAEYVIGDVSQAGGGINRGELHQIING